MTEPAREAEASPEIQALLGAGTAYEGKLTFEGRARVDGHFRGEVASPGVLILGDGADVEGTVRVGALIMRGGRLRGEVHATACVELYAAAELHGDVTTPQLFVEKGARFEGRSLLPATETHPLPER